MQNVKKKENKKENSKQASKNTIIKKESMKEGRNNRLCRQRFRSQVCHLSAMSE